MRRITVAGIELTVLHSPGHTPGAISLHAPDLGTVFTGDTLFAGGPGATGRSYSDFPTIIRSIRDRLLVLPLETVVRTGHGKLTTIGTEAPHLAQWIDRGYRGRRSRRRCPDREADTDGVLGLYPATTIPAARGSPANPARSGEKPLTYWRNWAWT
jgi:glyoxylase-like metal-dependent hydrolase (beta-lactamase superfamily II)